jgi:DNA-binding SARP family transcriptional activator
VDAGLLSGAGDLLPDWSDEWVLLERERLRMLRLHALEAFVERCLADGRFGDASEAAIAAVSSEPLRESAQRALISVYLAEGNRVEAIRQYRRFNDLLYHELGVAPSGQLTALIDELLIK